MNLSKSDLAAALAVAAVLGGASARAADPTPVFAAFTTVCAGPAADFTAVKSAADAQGWGASDAQAAANMPGVTVADQMTRSSATADKTGLVLSAWRGATKNGVKVSDCAVHVPGFDFAPLRERAATWLAFSPQESTEKRAIFRFTEAAGAHHALAAGEYDAAAGGAGMEILTVSAGPDGAVLDLMMIKK